MKRIYHYWLAVFIVSITFFVFAAAAAENATEEECVVKVKEAARLVKNRGVDQALATLSDKNGGFVWKDTYVFAMDAENATVIAHSISPKLVGKKLTGLKDINGKLFFAEFINLAKDKGEGWVEYMWPKPGEKTPSQKATYIYKVPGENVIMAAGIYK